MHVFSLDEVMKRKQLLCFHLLVIADPLVRILRHHIPTVVQKVDLLLVL